MSTQSERAQTDEGLRAERGKLDHEANQRLGRVDQEADGLLARARARADAVLAKSRAMVDATVPAGDDGLERREALAGARTLEDAILVEERAAADERLSLERAESARMLATLRPIDRSATDRLLDTERERSDVVLANRDDFLAMVSHDLRNLLSGIVTSAGVLAEEASDSDEGRRTVVGTDRIQRYCARMNRLVGDLVDVVSIDAGKLALAVLPADATRLVTEASDAFSEPAREKGIALSHTSGPGLEASFDHGRVLQVLANLVSNALKFTPGGGQIAIHAERSGAELRFSVKDSGAGIPPAMLEAVFERFWQMGQNDRRGLGLGLYISKCIVLAHGGRIWVESTLGGGSTFHFTLPAT